MPDSKQMFGNSSEDTPDFFYYYANLDIYYIKLKVHVLIKSTLNLINDGFKRNQREFEKLRFESGIYQFKGH